MERERKKTEEEGAKMQGEGKQGDKKE